MIKEIKFIGKKEEDVINFFINKIKAKKISDNEFIYEEKKWFIDKHPFDHSDDIIIEEKIIDKYDNFLLLKTGSNKIRIVGFTTKEQLKSTFARDIYRSGKNYYVVHADNVKNLEYFNINIENRKLLTEFIINQQQAENIGHTEMVSGLIAGLHEFCKKSKIYFKDINQKDECLIGNKKCKIYVRDIFSDEDMLIREEYYQQHPETELYILCKIKGGNYNYLGYVEKKIVDETRVVQMTGGESIGVGEKIRRIFADQYKNLSDILKIYYIEQKKEEKIIKQNYIPLHVHSEYSVGDGFGRIKYLVEQIYKKGFLGCALTDHGTLAGVYEFQKEMLSKNLKPLIGCEFYFTINEKKERNHLIIIAKNDIGWRNILKLQSLSVRENFYYKPILTKENLFNYSEGLIVTSACSKGIFYELLKEKKYKEFDLLVKEFKDKFKDDFYFEIQFHNIYENQQIMQELYEYGKKNNIKCVMSTDAHYPNKEDKKYQDAIKAINLKKKYGEANFSDDCFYLMQQEDIKEKINKDCLWITEEILTELQNNTFEILNKTEFKIIPNEEKDTLPKYCEEQEKKLIQLAYDGLKKYTKYNLSDKRIKDRLDLELDRIIKKGYANYFLIVYDLIKWAKENDVGCGVGRGSVGASLVAYCLNITECDPIEFDLLFDRFISEIRKDMPDIDMDFQDNKREQVFEYARNKYGINNFAKVVTNSRFHAKGVLRDIGRIFDIPISETEKICSMIIERSGGDARSSFTLMDTFEEFEDAKKFKEKYPLAVEISIVLESHIRHKGIHAGAMTLTYDDISSRVPINKVNSEIVIEWEKSQTEEMNIIKFDILGLKTLNIIKECLKDSKAVLPKQFNDNKVYDNIFNNGNTLGIFQFNTTGMTKFVLGMKVNNFNDLFDATTLFRPSALHSGQAQVYANRKNGKEPLVYVHPLLEKITKETRGCILYQEQVMQIMHDVGAMSWATAEMVRKFITKSKGKDAFAKTRDEFINNAKRIHHMLEDEGGKLYDVVSTFGSYGFNKAHAVEYSMISYYCAWLKYYYPKEFYKAILKYEEEDFIIQEIMQEAKKNNINIEYPEINKSEYSYSIKNKEIYAGLKSINGIGEKIAEKIINNRPYLNFNDFKNKVKISEELLKGLIIADVFREFKINKKLQIKNINTDVNQRSLFNFNQDIKKEEDFSEQEWSYKIFEYTSLQPKMDIFGMYDFGKYNFINIKDLTEVHGNTQQFIKGVVTLVIAKDKLIRPEWKKHEHHFEQHMYYLNVNDGTGNIAVQINPNTYEKYKNIMEKIEKKPIIAFGLLSKDGKKMYGDLLQIVSETKEIDNIFKDKTNIYILSAIPNISKNNKSYYRVILSNGLKGMVFRFEEKLFAGQKVKVFESQEPFLKIKVLK